MTTPSPRAAPNGSPHSRQGRPGRLVENSKAVIRQLATCRWVAEHHNVSLFGATGVGKSFIACALAHQFRRLLPPEREEVRRLGAASGEEMARLTERLR